MALLKVIPSASRLWLSSLALLNGMAAAPASAQTADKSSESLNVAEPRPHLKLQLDLMTEQQRRPAGQDAEQRLPTFLRADRLKGSSQADTWLEGNAEIRQSGQLFKGERLGYNAPNDIVTASDNVRVVQESMVISGSEMRLQIGTNEGYFLRPTYALRDMDGHGEADMGQIVNPNLMRLFNPNYSTCPVPDATKGDWFIKAETLDLNTATETGTARDAKVYFKGLPILSTPWMDFPLHNRRKSGLLPPSFGVTSRGGAEGLFRYYLDVAPNRDATLNARVVSKRGLQYGGQFRYLEPNYRGELRFERLDSDRQTQTDRYALFAAHTASRRAWSGGWTINKVSDDAYFSDFSRTLAAASQRTLPRDAYLSYAKPDYNVTARMTRFQTLQDPLAPIGIPYDRLPQVTFNGQKLDLWGADLTMMAEAIGFSHPTQVDGQRAMLRPSISYPILAPGYSLTPRVSVQSVAYSLNRLDPTLNPNLNSSASSTIPISSLDGKLIFERPLQLMSNQFIQTLEPRLYYLHVPFRDQSDQPLFDTAVADFNFAQIFGENRFTGQDRVGDASQLTASVVSRLIQDESGIERLRVGVGQRYNFKRPQIILPGQPATDRDLSDFLVGASGQITRTMGLDSVVQLDADTKRIARSNFGLRYRPAVMKQVNVNYRYTRDNINQIDIFGSWPITQKLVAVGRANYSIEESRAVETVAGFEYNAGCWAWRGVAQQFATAKGVSNTSLFVQLELSGFGRLGSNPLAVLRRTVPGYTEGLKRTPISPPFSDYE